MHPSRGTCSRGSRHRAMMRESADAWRHAIRSGNPGITRKSTESRRRSLLCEVPRCVHVPHGLAGSERSGQPRAHDAAAVCLSERWVAGSDGSRRDGPIFVHEVNVGSNVLREEDMVNRCGPAAEVILRLRVYGLDGKFRPTTAVAALFTSGAGSSSTLIAAVPSCTSSPDKIVTPTGLRATTLIIVPLRTTRVPL